jgi:hypothetical protein
VNITALLAGLGVGGVAVALALQNVLGDLVRLAVHRLGQALRGRRQPEHRCLHRQGRAHRHQDHALRSDSGEQIILSNADILKSRVRNFGRMPEQRALATLRVTYATPDRDAGKRSRNCSRASSASRRMRASTAVT